MQIVQMPYGGEMGEYHGIFSGDSDWQATAEECKKREYVRLDHYSDIDCFVLSIYDATDAGEDFCSDEIECRASVILSRRGMARLVRTILEAFMKEDYWFLYCDGELKEWAKFEAREAFERANSIVYTFKGEW